MSSREVLEDVLSSAADNHLPADAADICCRRRFQRFRFLRYWRRHGKGDRRAAWRAVKHNAQGVADALYTWDRLGENAQAQGEKMLGELLLHPGRLNEQLTAVRVVQTLTVLDVLNYREHVFQLGRYADMGDNPGRLLEWNTFQ